MIKNFTRTGRKGLRPIAACIFVAWFSLAAEEPKAPAVSGQPSSIAATAPPSSARSTQSEPVLAAIAFDGLPLSEVVKVVHSKFHGEFDVIVPDSDDSIAIRLSLRNVTYSEIFDAMNQLFTAQQTPFFWSFMQNGSRPTFTLMPRSSPNPTPEEERTHMVVYVGNSTTPDWPAEKMAELLSKIVLGEDFGTLAGSDRSGPKFSVNLHKSAEILVLSGSKKQVQFAFEALEAIREKARQKAVQDARLRESTAIKPAAPAQ
jgi:hypothetical protein